MSDVERNPSIYVYRDNTEQELVMTLPIVSDHGQSDSGGPKRRSTDEEVIKSAPAMTGLPVEEAKKLHYVVKEA